jgi:hypothetical protein
METSEDGWVLSNAALHKVIRAVRQQLGAPLNPPPNTVAKGGFGPHDIKSCTNGTGATLQPNSVVAISTPSVAVLSGSDLVQIVPRVIQGTTSYSKAYGITVGGPSTSGDGTLVSFSGGLVSYTGTAPTEGKSVGPVPNAFTVSTTGPPMFTVVGVASASSLCEVVPFHYPLISPVTLGAQLASAGAVNVTLSDGRVVNATNTAGQILEAGAALCVSDPFNGQHYITGSAKPSTVSASTSGGTASIWKVTSATTIAAGGTGGVTLSDGTTATVTNWATRSRIESGDKLTVYLDSSTGGHWAIPETVVARMYKGLLSGTLASTDTTVGVGTMVALDGRPGTTSITTCSNHLNLAGPSGAKCIVVEDIATASTAHILLNVQHYNC